MKKLILLLATASAFAQAPLNRVLAFNYTTEVTPSMAAHAFSSQDITLPLSNWTYLGSVTNLQFSNAIPIQLRWRKEFFVIGVSNEYTIGGISNLVFSDVLTSLPPSAARSQVIK